MSRSFYRVYAEARGKDADQARWSAVLNLQLCLSGCLGVFLEPSFPGLLCKCC
jgi:hypothetical protein